MFENLLPFSGSNFSTARIRPKLPLHQVLEAQAVVLIALRYAYNQAQVSLNQTAPSELVTVSYSAERAQSLHAHSKVCDEQCLSGRFVPSRLQSIRTLRLCSQALRRPEHLLCRRREVQRRKVHHRQRDCRRETHPPRAAQRNRNPKSRRDV